MLLSRFCPATLGESVLPSQATSTILASWHHNLASYTDTLFHRRRETVSSPQIHRFQLELSLCATPFLSRHYSQVVRSMVHCSELSFFLYILLYPNCASFFTKHLSPTLAGLLYPLGLRIKINSGMFVVIYSPRVLKSEQMSGSR